ncbi:hypothetical protein [Parapedobacter tibetensis]|nr:hypothetical protein [Parapedobacter tibetensis]
MPAELAREYNQLKSETRTPIWQFIGLGLILVFLSWIALMTNVDRKKERAYVAQPQVGDVYYIKTENNHYSTLKVMDVSQDSVHVLPNEYTTNKKSGVHKINKMENYGQFNYGFSKDDLRIAYHDGTIYTINRK